jgi:hypothetical protein
MNWDIEKVVICKGMLEYNLSSFDFRLRKTAEQGVKPATALRTLEVYTNNQITAFGLTNSRWL